MSLGRSVVSGWVDALMGTNKTLKAGASGRGSWQLDTFWVNGLLSSGSYLISSVVENLNFQLDMYS